MPVYIFQEITPENVQTIAVKAQNGFTAHRLVRETQKGNWEVLFIAPNENDSIAGHCRPNEPTENKVGCPIDIKPATHTH